MNKSEEPGSELIGAAKKGRKAINVITIEDALSNDNMKQTIREMIKTDVNVYFFLMEHVPELYIKYFSGISFEGVWEYTEFEDSVELLGTNLEEKSWYSYPGGDHKYRFPTDTIVLPDLISGKPVTTISCSAFAHNDGIRKVFIPETVIDIGESAFEGSGITEINLPSKIKRINARTFAECTVLHSIMLPDQLEEIGEMAFEKSGLTEITIPVSVKALSENAFLNCNAIIRKRLK